MTDEYSIFHGLVGVFATCAAIAMHCSPVLTAGVVLGMGLLHEIIDGDLIRASKGAPYEGIKDALSFLFPGPFLYLLLVR